jgi:hypothetical protein
MRVSLRREALLGLEFRLRRNDGNIIYNYCRLVDDGVIQGANHPNEAAWDVRDEMLVFLNRAGDVTTEFDTIELGETGFRLLGKFIPLGQPGFHILEPVSVSFDLPSLYGGTQRPTAKNSIAVARYTEGLEWLKLVPEDFDVIVYNKGGKIASKDAIDRASKIIELENVGRESQTYLHHILTYGRASDDFTVFAQADPFEHSPDFIKLLQSWRAWRPIQVLSSRFKSQNQIPPLNVLLDDKFDFIHDLQVRSEFFSLISLQPLHFYDSGVSSIEAAGRKIYGVEPGRNLVSAFLRSSHLEELADRAASHLIGRFSYGAIFAVRNELVDAVPQQTWERISEYLARHSELPYFLERMWLHIFGADFFLPLPAERL